MSKAFGKAQARGYSEGAHGHGGHHTFQPKPTGSNHMNNPHIAHPEFNPQQGSMKAM